MQAGLWRAQRIIMQSTLVQFLMHAALLYVHSLMEYATAPALPERMTKLRAWDDA